MATNPAVRSHSARSEAPRRVFVIGDVGGAKTFHLGDEAMLQANLERIRELSPGAELTVASRDPAWTARQYDVEAVPRPDLTRFFANRVQDESLLGRLLTEVQECASRSAEATEHAVPVVTARALARADALLVSGGGNLNGSWPDQLLERVLFLELAHKLGIPTAVTGQTLGPHLDSSQREVLRRVLSRPALVGVREIYSLRIARLLSVPRERVEYHLDDAFFQPRATDRRSPAEGVGEPFIGVTVTRFDGPLRPLADQLSRLATRTGCRLLLVPHVRQPDDDLRIAQTLVELMAPEIEAEAVAVPSVEEGRRLTESAALVLSMRYHPLVFAVAGGIPALGIYTDEYTRVKLRGALDHGSLADWVLPMEMALAGGLVEAAMDLWSRRAEVGDHLMQQRDRWWAMERHHRRLLGRALDLEPPLGDEQPECVTVSAPTPNSVSSEGPRPRGIWIGMAQAMETRTDRWFEERLGLLEQVDRAVEYALSLETTLVEREREIEGFKRSLEAQQNPVADFGSGTGRQ